MKSWYGSLRGGNLEGGDGGRSLSESEMLGEIESSIYSIIMF